MKRNLLGKISTIFGVILLGLSIVVAIMLIPAFDKNGDSTTYARDLDGAQGRNKDCNPGLKIHCSYKLKCRVVDSVTYQYYAYSCRRSPTFDDAVCLGARPVYKYKYYNNSSRVDRWGKCK